MFIPEHPEGVTSHYPFVPHFLRVGALSCVSSQELLVLFKCTQRRVLKNPFIRAGNSVRQS